jgi:CubicO group peptidase (beta-lactamase class C family)
MLRVVCVCRSGTLALCLLPLLLPAAARAQGAQGGPTDPAELRSFLDKVIGSYLAKMKIPGAVVSVVKDGKLLLARGYGYADLERKIPVSPETTLFFVGSVSKPVTATAVMQLVERGRLRLDADVNRYRFDLPDELREESSPIRSRHIEGPHNRSAEHRFSWRGEDSRLERLSLAGGPGRSTV